MKKNCFGFVYLSLLYKKFIKTNPKNKIQQAIKSTAPLDNIIENIITLKI